MRQDGEASVEEILESIKKVIARDNRNIAMETRKRRESDGLAEIARVMDSPPPASDIADDEEILDLGTSHLAEEVPSADSTTDISDDEDDDLGPLTTEAVRDAMRDNLAALAMLAEPGKPPQIVRSGETSLEELTRSLLRPMLAEWLDRNLPEIVERLVKAEISRIAGKRS
ncbi:DUF2497 domain-containing protein [Altererythrobacter sp. FM1]|uniref:DUF2497 domain-containing protein n=1 Tax=Tsuneonella flava TaxID=2055955 RepID=UPI000C7F7FC3|nr:DUF2497 domain-containing protein [Tsuneonella flava]ROT96831.1 DUF2497 domain-containing protein [Altererythrobacter sp. FM1]